MNQSDYRPVDKILGIVLLVYFIFGACCGGAFLGGGSILAGIGANQARVAGTADSAIPLAAAGGLLMLLGILIIGAYFLNLAGAVGVMKSRRWGFILTAILTGFTAL